MLQFDQGDNLKSLAEFERFLGDERNADNVMSHSASVGYDEGSLFPKQAVDACIKAGFFSFFIPIELGGSLSSFDQLVMQARAISRRDLTSAIAIGQTLLGALPVLLFGTDEHKRCIVEKIGRGALGCLALTEKSNGSDILSTALEARVVNGALELSGEKWLINNATRGESLTLLCRLHQSEQQRLCCVFVDKKALHFKGYENLDKIKTHGIRGADISGIRFHQCRLPLAAILPASGPDIFTVLKTLQISRVLCASFSLGAHDNALRTALAFATTRVLYRKPITQIPNVSRLLCQAYCQLLANESLSLVVARCIRHYPEQLTLYSALVKYSVPLATEQALTQLKTVLGARYYLREEHCEGIFQKNYRDNEVVSLFDGSSQVNLSIIASQLTALIKNLRKNDWIECEGINDLYADSGCLNHSSCLNADRMAVSNQGRDFILESFLALVMTDRIQQAGLGDCYVECALLLYRETALLIDAIEGAIATGQKDPNSVVFFDFADRYARLMCAVNYVLQMYYQRSTGDSLLQVDVATLCFLCEKLGGGAITDYVPACQRMMQQFEERQLFSRYSVALGKGASSVTD